MSKDHPSVLEYHRNAKGEAVPVHKINVMARPVR
jgi:hypothetical protein